MLSRLRVPKLAGAPWQTACAAGGDVTCGWAFTVSAAAALVVVPQAFETTTS